MTTERMKAAKAGKKTYFGNPCKHCGSTERFTANSSCVDCSRTKSRVYARERNRQIRSLLKAHKDGVK